GAGQHGGPYDTGECGMRFEITTGSVDDLLSEVLQEKAKQKAPMVVFIANVWYEGRFVDPETKEIMDGDLREREEFVWWGNEDGLTECCLVRLYKAVQKPDGKWRGCDFGEPGEWIARVADPPEGETTADIFCTWADCIAEGFHYDVACLYGWCQKGGGA
ncbi:MAG TPA: hypothetical protein VLM89_09015, partial [Phycisphaerae bacterium]|nr:hypothetical protein [Phycisphaerae bacterium]